MSKKQFFKKDINYCGEIAGFQYISSSLYEEKKSKFYGYIFEITSSKMAIEIIENIKKQFKDAKHVVYAYVLENEYYCSDDGEPSGTGGKAIYSLLEKQKVINTLVIVIRYFGGILLGVGPLSRAYIKAVKLAEEQLDIVPYVQRIVINITCDYNEESMLRNLIEKVEANMLNSEYGERITHTISIKEEEKELFKSYITC